MKCRSQPKFLEGKPIQITNVLEIRLASRYWIRIQTTAGQRKRTYSTISRYCVLRLARKCSLSWTPKLREARRMVALNAAPAGKLHRHMLCLYGEDEKLIRLAAMDLGLTITAFVRLALELYLSRIAMEKHCYRHVSDEQVKREAIRSIQSTDIAATNRDGLPLARTLTCLAFPWESFW